MGNEIYPGWYGDDNINIEGCTILIPNSNNFILYIQLVGILFQIEFSLRILFSKGYSIC